MNGADELLALATLGPIPHEMKRMKRNETHEMKRNAFHSYEIKRMEWNEMI